MQLAPPTLGKAHKKSCPTMFKSIESLDSDCGMDRCHYAVPFNGISIKSTPEIVFSSERNYQLQESEDERRAKLVIGDELARFLMGTIFLVSYPDAIPFVEPHNYNNNN